MNMPIDNNDSIIDILDFEKPPIIIPDKKYIACIGDSITQCYGVIENHDTNTWEYFLNQLLGDEYQVLNYGLIGRTLQDEGDVPYRKELFFKITHEIKADIYIIMLGTNDSKLSNWNEERFRKQYPEFVDSYLNLSNKPDVILMLPPMCFKDKHTGIYNFEVNPEIINGPIIDIIKETALSRKLKIIDLNTLTVDKEEWFVDGVHPNSYGNKMIGEYIAENVKELINENK